LRKGNPLTPLYFFLLRVFSLPPPRTLTLFQRSSDDFGSCLPQFFTEHRFLFSSPFAFFLINYEFPFALFSPQNELCLSVGRARFLPFSFLRPPSPPRRSFSPPRLFFSPFLWWSGRLHPDHAFLSFFLRRLFFFMSPPRRPWFREHSLSDF